MSTINSRLRGLAATLALVAFVVGVPAVLLAIDAVPDLTAFSWSQLTAPDDGTLVVEVLGAVCWIAWAVFTCQLVASMLSRASGIRTPRLPGLSMPQVAADRLIAAAALLFVAVPSATAFLPQPKAQAALMATPLPADPRVTVEPAAAPTPAPTVAQQKEPKVERYTVKRGDSLWRIAEDRLGDGARYVELVELNKAVLDGRPDFLLPGTVLRVPVAETAPAGTYVVQPGDTLSEIAEDELGDAEEYPSIFDASRGTLQADGARLTDPALILPGWKLTIPGQEPPAEARGPKHEKPQEEVPDSTSPPTETAPSEPANEPNAEPDEAGRSADDRVIPSWLVPGLAGAGSILGGALWIALRAQRRTQLRHRRPGTVIPPPPAELISAEKTARATASVTAPRIDALDAALRALPPVLPLAKVALGEDEIFLTLREAADLPAPWRGSDSEWRIAVADVPDRPEDSFPPFPLLVSVGQAADGSFLFLNLEELRTVTVTGNADRKAAFARHLAAELAVNPWSIVATVDLLGLGSDLASFNLGRVRTHPAGDTDFIAELARNLASITKPSDPDDFHAVIIATANRPTADLDQLAEVIAGIPGRSSAALVDLAGEPRSSSTDLQLTTDGRLQAPSLGVDVAAAGLSGEEARACALLLDLTLDETVVPVPQQDQGTAVSDLGGALVERLTRPRPEGPAGAESLLPLDAVVYTDAAATTVEDVEVLAPRAAPEARAAVEAVDPGLDEDLARWESPTLSSAKVTLLGPVSARTTGDTKATAHRRPFYVELLAYLALHPNGVSGADVAVAFAIRPERVRVDMSQLRRWLGTDPGTGEPYLPKAEPGRDPGSPALYKLERVQCDVDLFRRLRARGQSRGADGIDDLIAALRLVSGEPFSDLRKDHWNWLLEGDRWDHIMTSAVVDVGHIVTTHALATGDRDLALWAAQVAYTASPYDEVAQLDMIQAEKATGDSEQADQDLTDRVFNRRDDELPPIDLPDRTAQVAHDKNWGAHGPRPRRTG
ncbi:LysM peptidoglycan-binding domain-containing protein [Nocardioides agariphilus]|uniref:LysM peptidoglycan-binding domain-containing protein n=1 Tax=Nocardioides agariphilus TaxID=433664 RepID=A0A930VKY5_9ACTN|nr:LysM peptidoglycan-binding domain-containing protein [Nocardioides agariphilus]MBF4768618.1 LysM peptidoglycan-binding domain-containing protein [Nocardioides agariphilus]